MSMEFRKISNEIGLDYMGNFYFDGQYMKTSDVAYDVTDGVHGNVLENVKQGNWEVWVKYYNGSIGRVIMVHEDTFRMPNEWGPAPRINQGPLAIMDYYDYDELHASGAWLDEVYESMQDGVAIVESGVVIDMPGYEGGSATMSLDHYMDEVSGIVVELYDENGSLGHNWVPRDTWYD